MSKLPQHIFDESNGLSYTLHGDVYLPDLEVPASDQVPLGKYGLLRFEYLKKHRPIVFNQLLLSGKLWTHLTEIDHTCQARLDRMIPQMAKAEDVTEHLKMTNQMEWVGWMNNIKSRAEEILYDELIYV